jgi:hypothetical protein
VDAASLTVTFCPADVVSVKPVVDTLPTVPDDPPAAGPERALEPPPPAPRPAPLLPPACPEVADDEVVADGDVVVDGDDDDEQPATSTPTSATAAIHLLFRLRSARRVRRAGASSASVDSYPFMVTIL